MLDINVSLHKDGTIQVKGDLYFDNLVAIYKKIVLVINTLQIITLDLAGLTALDSSGLVLLTSLIKIARQENKKITVINIPKNLRDLARVSGVDILLPIDNIWL